MAPSKDSSDIDYLLGPISVEEEISRLNMFNDIYVNGAQKGNPCLAPIDLKQPGLKVLDAGCNDGAWFRSLSPSLTPPYELVGIDPLQHFFPDPPPPHTRFEARSFTDPWPSEFANYFDLVNVRATMAASGSVGVQKVVDGLVSCTKPGGWTMFSEMDMTDRPDDGPAMRRLWDVGRGFFEKIGVDGLFANNLKSNLAEAGCVDIGVQVVDVAAGPRCVMGSEMAKKGTEFLSLSAAAIVAGAHKAGALSDPEPATIVPQFDKELAEQGGVLRMVVTYGRKL